MGREEDKRILFDKPIPTVYEQWNAIQTNVHIYVNEEDKNKKTRKNGEYKK